MRQETERREEEWNNEKKGLRAEGKCAEETDAPDER
jgi:hypothetical protein